MSRLQILYAGITGSNRPNKSQVYSEIKIQEKDIKSKGLCIWHFRIVFYSIPASPQAFNNLSAEQITEEIF